MKKFKWLLNVLSLAVCSIFFLCLFTFLGCHEGKKGVILITQNSKEITVKYAIQKLEKKLTDLDYQVYHGEFNSSPENWKIYIGSYATDTLIKQRLLQEKIELSDDPESMLIFAGDRELFLSGKDGVGTMYAVLEAIEKLSHQSQESLYQNIKNYNDSPVVQERAISIYTMHRKSWETRLYDEQYWIKYFDLLASSRINSFVVIFGYENGGFLAPVYPYFFNVEEFPQIRMVGLTEGEQQKNIRAFRKMIELAHERGIKFTPGIWDHIYRAGVQGGGITGMNDLPDEPVDGLVWGLNAKNLADYTKIALQAFVDTFPDIDGIQFRMHWESGLTREETPKFWGEIFDMLKEKMPDLSIDLRTKGLPDVVIEDAIDKKLNFRLTTKYWMEQMGLPFHPMHINTENQFDRRHGYADLLTYPQHYKLHWRLWNGGTARILLWGDPAYVTRFIESTKVYHGTSFEVNEPLATKMEAQPHDMQPFALLNEPYRYYTYEFERYWYFYQLWGRLGYDPTVDQSFFDELFIQRFGPETGLQIRQGLHLASKVLPRIIASAYHYRFFPTTRGWVEKMRMEDLPEFAKAEATDIQLFVSAAEEAKIILSGGESPKVRSSDNAKWFLTISDSIFNLVEKIENNHALDSNKEVKSTLVDLKILGYLAQYYGRRIPAAISYNLYLQSENLTAFDNAIEEEKNARNSWQNLVNAAADIYSDDLRMGFCEGNMCGHWSDELLKLNEGITVLEAYRDSISDAGLQPKDLPPLITQSSIESAVPSISILPNKSAKPFEEVKVQVQSKDGQDIKWIRLQYRHLTQFEDYQSVQMKAEPGQNTYSAAIPSSFVDPKWDLMFFVEVMSKDGRGKMYPDFTRETPYVILEIER